MRTERPGLSPSIGGGYWDIEPVQRDRDEAVQSDKIDQLSCPMLVKGLYGLPIVQLGQGAVLDQGRRDVISDSFFAREIARTLAGNDGGELIVRQPASLGGDDVGIELIR